MSVLLLFAGLIVLVFLSVLLTTRPTRKESRIEQRLNELSRTTERETEESIMVTEHLSRQKMLDEVLQRFPIFTALKRTMQQADINWDVGYLLVSMVALALVALLLAHYWAPNLLIDFVPAVLAALSPLLYIQLKRAARLHRFQHYLPEAVDLMARAMRAGHPLASAVEIVSLEIPAPVGTEFRRVFEEQSLGLPIREALLNMAARVPVRELELLITAMLVQKETGGNLVEILEKTANILRERIRLLGQLRIYTAQGRLSGWILCLLPFILFVMLALLNPGYTDILLKQPLGQKLTLAGIGFMAIGILSIRKIINIKV